jgi:hypothetical protein
MRPWFLISSVPQDITSGRIVSSLIVDFGVRTTVYSGGVQSGAMLYQKAHTFAACLTMVESKPHARALLGSTLIVRIVMRG